MMEWLVTFLQQAQADFIMGLLVGLTIGVLARFAVRFLAFAAGAFFVFELLRQSGVFHALGA